MISEITFAPLSLESYRHSPNNAHVSAVLGSCVCLTVNSIDGETVRLLCWIRLTLDGWTDARKRINIWFGSQFQIQWSNAHRAQPIHSLIEFRCRLQRSLRQISPQTTTTAIIDWLPFVTKSSVASVPENSPRTKCNAINELNYVETF